MANSDELDNLIATQYINLRGAIIEYRPNRFASTVYVGGVHFRGTGTTRLEAERDLVRKIQMNQPAMILVRKSIMKQ